MTRTPSTVGNLVKAQAVRAAGFKTYIHSVIDGNGVPFYANRVRELFLQEGKGAKAIRKVLVEEYPGVEPPSVTAIQNFCRNHMTVALPVGTMDASKRPDAIKSMYTALEVVEGELTKAQKMQGESGVPLPMIRGIAMNIVQIAEKIVGAEKAVGMSPINVTNIHGDVTMNQQNITNAQQIVISDPQAGKELLDEFKAFETEIMEYQANAAVHTTAK